LLADVLEYEPDADMIFNYLMVSALASATDYIERNNIKPTGGQLTHLNDYIKSFSTGQKGIVSHIL
jgi:hypothetical protein